MFAEFGSEARDALLAYPELRTAPLLAKSRERSVVLRALGGGLGGGGGVRTTSPPPSPVVEIANQSPEDEIVVQDQERRRWMGEDGGDRTLPLYSSHEIRAIFVRPCVDNRDGNMFLFCVRNR